MIEIIAPAKINLFLHVTGKREDNYHLINSLFAFTKFGDTISIQPAEQFSLTVSGSFSAALSNCITTDNLIYRVAQRLKKQFSITAGAHIQLTKNIPVSAGIGGGSADAASAIKALNKLWRLNLSIAELSTLCLPLGADIPACLYEKPAIVSGIGESIAPLKPANESIYILLVNPKLPLSTPAVFDALNTNRISTVDKKTYTPNDIPSKPIDFIYFLKQQHNDLEIPAKKLLPAIQQLLYALKELSGCQLARMSGSGPTCFALFYSKQELTKAKGIFLEKNPLCWVTATELKY